MYMYCNWLQPALQNLLQCVVRFFHQRSSCTTTHILADVQRITFNASCMMISGGRTKQLDIFCCVTGFTSDFLSFIVVELIRFFHRALQLFSICCADNKICYMSCMHMRHRSFRLALALLQCCRSEFCYIYICLCSP